MKRYIITAVATALLSSCGIYNRYTSVTDVPEDLYGNQVKYSWSFMKRRGLWLLFLWDTGKSMRPKN